MTVPVALAQSWRGTIAGCNLRIQRMHEPCDSLNSSRCCNWSNVIGGSCTCFPAARQTAFANHPLCVKTAGQLFHLSMLVSVRG
jgi:hypothetical protein